MKRKLNQYYDLISHRGIIKEKTWIDPKKLKWGEGFSHPMTAVASFDVRGFTEHELTDGTKTFVSLQLLYYALWESVKESSCFIEKQTGDGILLIYPQEDQSNILYPLKHVSQIFALIKNDLNPFLKEKGVNPLSMGIGVDMGEVVITKVGLPYNEFHFMSYGHIPNFAAKMSHFGADEVLIGESYRTLIKEQYGELRQWSFNKHTSLPYHLDKTASYTVYKAQHLPGDLPS